MDPLVAKQLQRNNEILARSKQRKHPPKTQPVVSEEATGCLRIAELLGASPSPRKPVWSPWGKTKQPVYQWIPEPDRDNTPVTRTPAAGGSPKRGMAPPAGTPLPAPPRPKDSLAAEAAACSTAAEEARAAAPRRRGEENPAEGGADLLAPGYMDKSLSRSRAASRGTAKSPGLRRDQASRPRARHQEECRGQPQPSSLQQPEQHCPQGADANPSALAQLQAELEKERALRLQAEHRCAELERVVGSKEGSERKLGILIEGLEAEQRQKKDSPARRPRVALMDSREQLRAKMEEAERRFANCDGPAAKATLAYHNYKVHPTN